MTDRGLKIALAVSVAVNVFVVGAVAGGLIVGGRFLAERRGGDRPPVMALVATMEPPARLEATESLRQAGMEARPDFETARGARLDAVELAGAETFDRAAVEAALDRSVVAEHAGRRRLERAYLDILQPLDRAERQRLAPGLARRGPDRGRRHGRFGRGEGPIEMGSPPPDGVQTPSPETPPAG